jgi:hypothetical protein
MVNHITLKPNHDRITARNRHAAELFSDGPLAKVDFIGQIASAPMVNWCQTPTNKPVTAPDTIAVRNCWP